MGVVRGAHLLHCILFSLLFSSPLFGSLSSGTVCLVYAGDEAGLAAQGFEESQSFIFIFIFILKSCFWTFAHSAKHDGKRLVADGGSARESNPPRPFLTSYTGFEDRGQHQLTRHFHLRASRVRNDASTQTTTIRISFLNRQRGEIGSHTDAVAALVV